MAEVPNLKMNELNTKIENKNWEDEALKLIYIKGQI